MPDSPVPPVPSDLPPDLDTVTCAADVEFILSRRPDADSFEGYKEAVCAYVELSWNFKSVGVPLRVLNSRFCQLAIRFKVKAADVAQILAREGRIGTHRWRGSLILFPAGWTGTFDPDRASDEIVAACKRTLDK